MGIHKGGQRRQRPRLDNRIAIEQQHIASLRQGQALVVGCCKADVAAVLDQVHLGKALVHHRRAAVGRGVIHHERFHAAGLERLRVGTDGFQAPPQQLARVPAHDDDG
jgi:hypothetical protein